VKRSRFVARKNVLLIAAWLFLGVANTTTKATYARTTTNQKEDGPFPQQRYLLSEDPQIVAKTCMALAESRLRRATPDILAVVSQSESPAVQASCAFALGRIGAPEAAKPLASLANDPTREIAVRIAAIRASSLIQNADTNYLINLLDDKNAEIQSAAAYSICQLRLVEGIPKIKQMLTSNDPIIRQAALTASTLWPEAFVSELVGTLEQSRSTAEDKIESLTALDTVAADQLSNETLQRVAQSVKTQPSSEIAQGVGQLLSESSVGRTLNPKVEVNMAALQRPQTTDQETPVTAESLDTSKTTRHLWWELIAVAVCGAFGGFVNVFIGDSGLHLPTIDEGVFRPGYIGVVFVGLIAAVGAWLATQTSTLVGELAQSPQATLRLSELSTAIIVGFGGARWFKSETETTIFRKTAAVAASKEANSEAAAVIASGTPLEALTAANRMR
jgi:hypothetical protein